MNKKALLFIIITLTLLGAVAYFGSHMIKYIKAETVKKRIESYATIKNGDLIFQISLSQQSKAIQLATRSEYSHCGIIYEDDGKYYVFEAVQPVKLTTLDKWIHRGKDGHYVVKRLKNAEEILTTETLNNMKRVGEQFIGKDYDLTFEWSDDRMYCSELIWKIYERVAGVEIGKLQKLAEFDLSHPIVQVKIKERYSDNIPLDEVVISPAAIFESDQLITVTSK